ncbi:NAD(P)-dependent oxidoreductase [Chromatium weissei]|nr:NAD(P)-dependent oxidoreductase [Chromatium weissei]
MNTNIIIGCGEVGTRLARQLRERSETVLGVVRSAASVTRLTAAGITGIQHDLLTDSAPASTLVTTGAQLFHFAPPPESGVIDLHTQHLLQLFARTGQPRRIVYISTTGVYGDCQGAWIDETHSVQPQADRSHRRWNAERQLQQWRETTGGEVVILRVAGIYDPQHLPLARLQQGTPLVRTEEAPYTNRIHVDDLVTVCRAAMERGVNGAVYNVCDGHPSTMTEYFLAIADAVGLPHPPLLPLVEAMEQLSAGMRSYMAESRRLSNRKLREELGVALRYSDLAAGLREISVN